MNISGYGNNQMACQYEAVRSKNTRHYEFRTTVNVFQVILLASTPRESLDISCKQGPRRLANRTVPNSIYTAVPQVAMNAPTSHVIKATPTLPDERRMLLGVAYNLRRRKFVRTHCLFHKLHITHPVPIIQLKKRKVVLKTPTE